MKEVRIAFLYIFNNRCKQFIIMKFFQLILVFAACVTLAACGSDGAKEKTITQPEKANQVKTIKKPSTPAASNFPAFEQLTKVKPSTRYAIGMVNKQKPSGNKTIVINGPRFTMTGWAVDTKADQAASGVYVVIDGKPYLAKYGNNREDVAKAFKNPAFKNCGFILNIPTASISKGVHEVFVRVVSTDKKRLFAANKAKKIMIDVK